MANDTLTDAIAVLRWAQRALDTQAANRAGAGSPEMAEAVVVARTDPGNQGDANTANADALAVGRWKHSCGYDVPLGGDWPLLLDVPPTVLVGAPWADLAPRPAGHRRVRNRVWLGTTYMSRVDDEGNQPDYPTLAASPITTDRVHRVGVLADASDAPATAEGTHALVTAAVACTTVADYLTTYAEGARARSAGRFRSEAAVYREHADACTAALSASLAWVGAFEQSLEPVPPFTPQLVPAQLRGFAVLSPY